MEGLIYCFICTFIATYANKEANRLFEDLLSDYNKLVRPVNNNNETLNVHFKLKLSQLLDVHEKNQIMTTNVWLQHTWVDQKLKWNPSDYGGVNVLYVPADMIWLPDIVLYNNADGNYQVQIMMKAKVMHNGTIEWTPPAIYKSMCQIDIEWFPFDIQECDMKFGSWTYGGYELDLKHKDGEGEQQPKPSPEIDRNDYAWIIDEGIDLDDYYHSVEWDILGVPAHRHEKYYRCCPAPFVDITYKIKLKRKTLFYIVNLVFPCVGISFLTALVFYLPSDSGEKISLCISVLISLTIFFLLLVEIIPSTSLVIPLIGKYLLFTMVLVTFSVVVTVITLNVHFRSPNTHTMPTWIQRVFLNFLPRLLNMRRPSGGFKEFDSKKSKYLNYFISNLLKFDGDDDDDDAEERQQFIDADERNQTHAINKTFGRQKLQIERSPHDPVRLAVESVCYIAEHFKKVRSDERIIADWKYVALVMDRLFLWMFSISCIVGTVIIIFRAPTIYNSQKPIA